MSTSSPTKTRDDHTGNAILTAFAFTFIIAETDEVEVYVEGRSPTKQVLVTDYSVVINANGTGTVTFVVAPEDTKKVALVLKRRRDQTTAYKNQSTWKGLNFENSYDKLTQLMAELDDRFNFTLRFDLWHTDVGDNLIVVGDAATRASKALGFDAAGNVGLLTELGQWRGVWATATGYALGDIVRDTSPTPAIVYRCNTAHTSSGALPISTNADSAKWDLVVKDGATGGTGPAGAGSLDFSTTADPTANSDSAGTDGNGTFSINSVWTNTTSKDKFICEDATATAAVWRKIVYLDANGLPNLPYDVAFVAGYDNAMVKEDVAVQTYGELVMSRTGSFVGESGYADTAPTGAALILDIEKNGTTIYTTKPQFAAGSQTLTAGTLKTDGTEDFVAGDRIAFKITQIGSTLAGQGVRLTVKAEV